MLCNNLYGIIHFTRKYYTTLWERPGDAMRKTNDGGGAP